MTILCLNVKATLPNKEDKASPITKSRLHIQKKPSFKINKLYKELIQLQLTLLLRQEQSQPLEAKFLTNTQHIILDPQQMKVLAREGLKKCPHLTD